MNSNINDLDYQQHNEQYQGDQVEYEHNNEVNNGNFNTERVGGNQMVDIQSSENQFAMDVNLNSFEGFSQTEEQQQVASKSSTEEPHHQHQGRRPFHSRPARGQDVEEEKDILNKIFVGGIHPDTTEESLKEHFAKFGTIIDHVIIKDPTTKRSRGFGFVKYSESLAVDEVF